MNSSVYLKCEKEEVAENVVLIGDPGRIELAERHLGDMKYVSQNREFNVITGDYQGTPITFVSSGIGSPSLAIALEELAELGAKSVLRAGTAMSITAELGSFTVSTGAIRWEGTSDQYLPPEFPSVPDLDLAYKLVELLRSEDTNYNHGMTATFDSFYSKMAPKWINKERKLDQAYRTAKNNGVLSMDMETSLLFSLGAYLELSTSSLCLVTNMPEEPGEQLEGKERKESESVLIKLALEGLHRFDKE